MRWWSRVLRGDQDPNPSGIQKAHEQSVELQEKLVESQEKLVELQEQSVELQAKSSRRTLKIGLPALAIAALGVAISLGWIGPDDNQLEPETLVLPDDPDLELVTSCTALFQPIAEEIRADFDPQDRPWPAAELCPTVFVQLSGGEDVRAESVDQLEPDRIVNCGLTDIGVSNEILLASGETLNNSWVSQDDPDETPGLIDEVTITIFDIYDPALRDDSASITDGIQPAGWCRLASGRELSFEIRL